MRVFLTIVLPLALPTALYLLWLRVARWSAAGGAARWHSMPWTWLVGAGVLLLAAVLVTITVHFGTQQPGIYVPPHLSGSRIVPGHIEPGSTP